MRSIGVRELKARASAVIREVQRNGAGIDVTHHGRIVARIVPVAAPRPARRQAGAIWATLDRVARDIAVRWPRGLSATKAVREGRRRL